MARTVVFEYLGLVTSSYKDVTVVREALNEKGFDVRSAVIVVYLEFNDDNIVCDLQSLFPQ